MALSGPPSISVHTWRRRWYAAASRTSGLRGSIATSVTPVFSRIDRDARDVLGLLQSHVLPRFAPVVGTVHAVAIGHAALAVVLSRADPHHVGILRVDRHRADRVRAFAVEYGRE